MGNNGPASPLRCRTILPCDEGRQFHSLIALYRQVYFTVNVNEGISAMYDASRTVRDGGLRDTEWCVLELRW